MKTEMYGYVRVSSKDQCEARQVLALREFKVPEHNIYMDKMSGKDFNRPQYRRMVRKLKAGDVLVVTGVFVADLVLQILSYVAQTERENIRQRQMEGIAAAKQRGVKFGRPKKQVPEEFARLREKWMQKEVSSREATKRLGISQDTFLRWSKNMSE